jgi:Holliday junction resolvase
MGKSSKRKGAHYERHIVKLHTEIGIVARKTPLSGALKEFPGDVTVADHFICEVKARKLANGFKVVRDWLGSNHVLFLQEIAEQGKGASPKPIVVIPWDQYVAFMKLWGEQQDQP